MKTKAPFKVGYKVTTDFFGKEESRVVRTVETCVQDDKFGSGWRVSADGGDICPTCKRAEGTPVRGVDSSWFIKIKPTTGGLAF